MESLPPRKDDLERLGASAALRVECDRLAQLSLADEELEHDGLSFGEWVASLPVTPEAE